MELTDKHKKMCREFAEKMLEQLDEVVVDNINYLFDDIHKDDEAISSLTEETVGPLYDEVYRQIKVILSEEKK